VNLSLSNTTVASASGAGMNIDGTAGAGTIFITAFANNAVTHAGAGGVLMNKVTFDSNLTTTGFQQVLAGSLTVGDQSDTTQVTGDGVRLISPTGSLSLGVLKIANDNGTGLLVNTKVGPTTFTLASLTGSEISTTNGPATNLDPLSASLQFSSLSSSNSGTSGILVDTVSGTFNSSSVFIHDSAAKSIVVKNTPATLNMNMGTTTIDSLLGPTQADNVDTSTNNGTFLNLSFTKLTINYP
jgi:hypothetical protein